MLSFLYILHLLSTTKFWPTHFRAFDKMWMRQDWFNFLNTIPNLLSLSEVQVVNSIRSDPGFVQRWLHLSDESNVNGYISICAEIYMLISLENLCGKQSFHYCDKIQFFAYYNCNYRVQINFWTSRSPMGQPFFHGRASKVKSTIRCQVQCKTN